MTSSIAAEAFSAFVRDHLGDYGPKAVTVIRTYLKSIGHDHEALRATLRHQSPPCELIAPIEEGGVLLATPTSDGTAAPLPGDGAGMHQVMPAYASYRIGHVLQREGSWVGFHFTDSVGETLDRATQFEAVLSVFVAHFEWLGRVS